MTIESTNDNIPTTPAITYSECYRLPFLSLFHADCMEIMQQYHDKYFDLAIVEPPYGINADTKQDKVVKMKESAGNYKVLNTAETWDKAIEPKSIYSRDSSDVSY